MSEDQNPGGPPPASESPSTGAAEHKDTDKGLLIQGAVVGGIVLLVLIAALFGAF